MSDGTDLAQWAPLTFEGKDINVTLIDGTPWFRADQVCGVLAVRTRDAVSALDEDEKMRIPIAGVLYDLMSEPGLYSTVMRSRKPEAKRFKKWVTGQVLPSIRATGGYRLAAAPLLPQSLPEALRAYAAEVEAREAAEQRAAELAPSAEAFGVYLNAEGLKPVGVVAQELGIGQNRLFEFLRQHRVLINQPGARFNTPYQAHIETGRFVVKAGTRDSTSEGTKATYTTYVTPKGEAFILRLIKDHGPTSFLRALDRVTSEAAARTTIALGMDLASPELRPVAVSVSETDSTMWITPLTQEGEPAAPTQSAKIVPGSFAVTDRRRIPVTVE